MDKLLYYIYELCQDVINYRNNYYPFAKKFSEKNIFSTANAHHRVKLNSFVLHVNSERSFERKTG